MKCFNSYAWSALAISLALAGCGGGGGGGAAPPPPDAPLVSIPLTTAFANFANQSNSSTVGVTGTATISGQTFNVTGSGTVSESTGSGTFEGVAALQKNTTLTGSITVNGVTAPVADVGITYFSSNYQPLGGSSTDGYCVTTSTNPAPATEKAGDTGFWYAESCYSSISRRTVIGTATIR